MEPVFLNLAEVLAIHEDQINGYGGSPGIRDLELLKSAMCMPPATFGGEFLHGNIYEMAAAYLFHIVKNHPFIDGNKRTGTVAAIVFLVLNGHDFRAPQEELVKTVVAVAAGKLDKAELMLFFRRWTRRR